jgi:hypothetical protein
MPLVDLALAKRHLRVLHDDEDAEIELYTSAAENIVVEYLDRVVLPVGETLPSDDPTSMHVTTAITAAILLMLGDLYENREADRQQKSDAVMPPAVRALLAPWRVWRNVVCEDEQL